MWRLGISFLLAIILAASPLQAALFSGAPLAALVPSIQVSYGDSITEGAYILTPSQEYSYILHNTLSIPTWNNLAVGQTMSCDNLQKNQTTLNVSNGGGVFGTATGGVTTPSLSNATLYTIALGTNDANSKLQGSYEAVFDLCQLANISWLAIPITSKITAQSCTKSGSWSNDTIPVTGFGLTSTTNGNTLTCSITTQGKPLMLYFFAYDGDGGTGTYSVAGGPSGSFNCFTSPAIATDLGATSAIVAIRIPGVSAGTHTVTITVTSATSGSNPVDIFAMGSAPSGGYANSMVTLVGDVIRQLFDNDMGDTAAYAADTVTIVNQLAGDGLPVYLAPQRAAVADTLMPDMVNQLHTDATGQVHQAAAFAGAFP